MSRRVWPHQFLLQTVPLTEAFRQGRNKIVVDNIFDGDPDRRGIPVALRWVTHPNLGFPRMPFQVFRRRRQKSSTTPLFSGPGDVGGLETIRWGAQQMYEVTFSATSNPGHVMVIDGVDVRGEMIPGQRIAVTGSRTGRFRSPGIAALQVTGSGEISNVRGVEQTEFANADGWELIEVVGFPFASGEVGAPVYSDDPQGVPPALTDGRDAALLRLEIARIMYLSPPATGVADIPTPDWPAPDPLGYLETMRAADPSALRLIFECLSNSDDTDPGKLQAKFVHKAKLPGIVQSDLPGATPGPDATFVDLPVVAVTMLAAGSEPFASVGLGYGTVDLPSSAQFPSDPDFVVPPGTVHTAFDYMVTAHYTMPAITLPNVGVVVPSRTFELAALSTPRPAPEPVSDLKAATVHHNRAPEVDQPLTVATNLSWDLSNQLQGYGIAISERSGAVRVLNSDRPIAGGFDSFVPDRPEAVNGNVPVGARAKYTSSVGPLPVSGTEVHRYIVAALDVFGRWSNWRTVDHAVSAIEIIAPGLHSAEFVADVPGAVGHVVPCQLEIEFSWDWSDRSPLRVAFEGNFFSAGATAAPSSASGFPLSDGAAGGPSVVVEFDPLGNPVIATAHEGSVETLVVDPPDPNVRKYRLAVRGMSCDFSTANEIAFAVFAIGTERIRPTEPSNQVGPKVARSFDPLPPAVPTLPVDLRWTALPDATGQARGVLTWPASSKAVGYVVWQATEPALRQAVEPGIADPPAGTSLLARAEQLRDLVTQSNAAQQRSLRAFSRINTRLIESTSLEIELPGTSEVIFSYRVSSVSESNEESNRSETMAMFAVPQRNEPGQPNLLLRAAPQDAHVNVIAFPSAGPTPAGYRVHRAQHAHLLHDLGSMGPPIIQHDDPGWQNYDFSSLDGTVSEAGLSIVDPVTPSWFQYFYRIVAVGADNSAGGQLRGESVASSSQQISIPPLDPPLLDGVSLMGNDTNLVLTLRTNLPVRKSKLGAAVIELFRLAVHASGRRMVRDVFLAADPVDVIRGEPLVPLVDPTDDELAAMPEISRSALDSDGRAEFTIRMTADQAEGFVDLIDPLGRSTQQELPELSP